MEWEEEANDLFCQAGVGGGRAGYPCRKYFSLLCITFSGRGWWDYYYYYYYLLLLGLLISLDDDDEEDGDDDDDDDDEVAERRSGFPSGVLRAGATCFSRSVTCASFIVKLITMLVGCVERENH